jgi:hypothetical protein
MDFFLSVWGGGGVYFWAGLPTLFYSTHYIQGIWNNMVHLATNVLSIDVFDKATFNKVNI